LGNRRAGCWLEFSTQGKILAIGGRQSELTLAFALSYPQVVSALYLIGSFPALEGLYLVFDF
jgi:hypothetical protein